MELLNIVHLNKLYGNHKKKAELIREFIFLSFITWNKK